MGGAGTYQFQLLELHQSLFHARLVHFNLLVLLPDDKLMVAIALRVLRGDLFQGPSFVLSTVRREEA